uniref:Queuine tRNA-ribosyltransferase n=1 Tax=Lygus hesperus TaxID=30085 RepID=A0A146LJK6_LYGHE
MFDCVWPSRTARFGSAITPYGVLKLPRKEYQDDISVLCDTCPCIVCSTYRMPKFYLHHLCGKNLGCSLLTIHNLTYMAYFMESIRKALRDGVFPQFVQQQLRNHYPDHRIPLWLYNVFSHVGCLDDTFVSE